MFNKLYKKYMYSLLPIIIFIVILYSSIAITFYMITLSNDYSQKESDFNKQQAENFCERLNLTSQCVDMFFEKYSLNTTKTQNNYYIKMALKKIKYSNIDITSVFLKSSDKIHSLTSSDLEFGHFLTQNYSEIFHNTDNTPAWYYLKAKNPENDSLLCIKSVPESNNALCVILKLDNKTYQSTTNASDFTFKNRHYTIIPDESVIITMSASTATPLLEAKNNNSTKTIYLSDFPFRLEFQKTTGSLNKMFGYLSLLLAIICIIIITLSYLLLKNFLISTTDALSSLYDNFQKFQFSLDNEQRNKTQTNNSINEGENNE